ncbi:Hypothetical membrane protein [Zobellia galactanivorans]|uniref:Hypothetical membrane protein n=1 Tax=Zobellia galactanivorans (strain DSM 12802 / CCUG 47099 / CIP 106680 / NCIMB 13871 / Dsij) TaxID=63186 RepID=G0LBM8_ZOBGA|nr:Hypothetical membrane protein [Zobellia galactanivorans]
MFTKLHRCNGNCNLRHKFLYWISICKNSERLQDFIISTIIHNALLTLYTILLINGIPTTIRRIRFTHVANYGLNTGFSPIENLSLRPN